MAAGHYKLDNLVFIIDYNKVQAKGFLSQDMGIEPLADKLRGVQPRCLRGPQRAQRRRTDRPVQPDRHAAARQAHRRDPEHVKGKKVGECQYNPNWHTSAPRDAERPACGCEELWEQDGKRLGIPRVPGGAHRGDRDRAASYTTTPTRSAIGRRRSDDHGPIFYADRHDDQGNALPDGLRPGRPGDEYPDRSWRWTPICAARSGLHIFEHYHPAKLVKVGIAEQNLIAVAAGLSQEGYIPFPLHLRRLQPALSWISSTSPSPTAT